MSNNPFRMIITFIFPANLQNYMTYIIILNNFYSRISACVFSLLPAFEEFYSLRHVKDCQDNHQESEFSMDSSERCVCRS